MCLGRSAHSRWMVQYIKAPTVLKIVRSYWEKAFSAHHSESLLVINHPPTFKDAPPPWIFSIHLDASTARWISRSIHLWPRWVIAHYSLPLRGIKFCFKNTTHGVSPGLALIWLWTNGPWGICRKQLDFVHARCSASSGTISLQVHFF